MMCVCVHTHTHTHTDDQSLAQIILKEYWKLDLAYGLSTPTDENVQGASQILDTLTK